jgi:hypothetical protein
MWVVWVSWCNLVPQLPRVINFAYDLCFRHVISCWKGISENYTLHHHALTSSIVKLCQAKKKCLGPQNNPESTTRCDDMKTYKIGQLD